MLLIFTNTQLMQGSSESLLLPHPSLGTAPPRSFVIEKLKYKQLKCDHLDLCIVKLDVLYWFLYE